MTPRLAGAPVAVFIYGATAICVLLLVLPASTISTKYFNDLLVFLDGGYRVALGQIPNRDFHTALGPLSFYVPGIGYWISGRLGAAMPVGMATLMICMAPIMVHVLGTRLRPLLAIPLGLLLVLVLATPHNTGEMFTNISFAMFYNRIGWALLGLLLVMHLAPLKPARHQIVLDSVAAIVLSLVLLYTKVSYGLVAIAFLCLVLLQPVQRRWAAISLGSIALAIGLIELLWGGTAAHIADLITAANVSGSKTVLNYLHAALDNFAEYSPYLLLAGLAVWRTRSIHDVLFYGFCACAGLALVIQNFQEHGIVTLLAGAAVAAEQLARSVRDDRPSALDLAARGGWLAALLLMLPVGLASAGALGLHTGMAVRGTGTALDLPNAGGIKVAQTINRWDYEFYRRYADTLEAGSDLLEELDVPASKVLVIDFASPFTSLIGLDPPRSGTAWMHDGRNFDSRFHVPPDELLRDIDVVMIPKVPVAGSTTSLMQEIYGDHFETHYTTVRETQEWLILQRADDDPVSRPVNGRS